MHLPPRFRAVISIHALREEGDFAGVAPFGDCFLFLSTPSARRATQRAQAGNVEVQISIHALREEGDIVLLAQNKIA